MSFRLQFIIAFFVILGGCLSFYALFATRPEVEKRTSEPILPRVVLETFFPEARALTLRSQGTVVPRARLRLSSEVSGRVTQIHPLFEEGFIVPQGTVLVELDPSDYEAAVTVSWSNLANARLRLALEEAEAEQSLLDWSRLNPGSQPSPLVSRTFQLEARKAEVEAAAASLAQAERNLERTRIATPFTGRIRMRDVEVGELVATGSGRALGEIDSIDLLVTIPVSPSQLALLNPASLFNGSDAQRSTTVQLNGTGAFSESTWTGSVERFSASSDPSTRFSSLTIALDRHSTHPLTGSFLDVSVEGRRVDGVYLVPRSAIFRDREVLQARPAETTNGGPAFSIHALEVEILQSIGDQAVIRSSQPSGPLTLVTTPLRTYVSGMLIRIASPENSIDLPGPQRSEAQIPAAGAAR